MTPDAFIAKWRASSLKESAASQEHFIDLCRLLGEPTPAEADPAGDFYTFEFGATKATGGQGWADVWKRGCFGWEYKGKDKDLQRAYGQLLQYAAALENPPLLIVSDMETIVLYTNWTNTVREIRTFTLDDLRNGEKRDLLKAAFSDPERLKPGRTRQAVTEDAAREFAEIAKRLRDQGFEPHRVAHFINRLVFCMFAEDVGLLPNDMFKRILERASQRPERFESLARQLFAAMAKQGGEFGVDAIAWFNGGLFDDDDVLPLDKPAIDRTLSAARLDWADIDPSIFGTLFERGLDPDKRSQLGAHYTDRDKIMMIIEPVIMRQLTREWTEVRANIKAQVDKIEEARARVPATQAEARKVHRTARQAEERARREAQRLANEFIERLANYRVLDPACGSGNFLYLALLALKDFEHRVNLELETMELLRQAPSVGPQAVRGIEINDYAAELARATIWIGELQWMRRNGFNVAGEPILKPLDSIERRDAVLTDHGTEAPWPPADAIIGNPPFLGGKRMRDTLGSDYVDQLFGVYDGRVPAEADLVCYWFEKARASLAAGESRRVGLVATNSIRGGANRVALDRLAPSFQIFEAWSDEPWVVEGADVRVSIVCIAAPEAGEPIRLDGQSVPAIHSDLSSGGVDLTKAQRLAENGGIAFMGDTKGGAFDVPGDTARQWLSLPLNPNGHPNADVLRPWMNGMDVTRRSAGKWIIDFGWTMTEQEAALYQEPFAHLAKHVKPERQKNRREAYRLEWWRHVEPRPGMCAALASLSRFIVTPTVAKHRLFAFLPRGILPDHQLIAIARDDDTLFGILHSRFHESWSLRCGTWLGVGNDPRYTPSTTFETFPFPEGLTPDAPTAGYASDPRAVRIAQAARRLNEQREAWLNPADLVRREAEIVPGFPDRVLPVDDKAAAVLKKRTLTNLYNERPAWLDNAHRELDAAVAAAYGWPADISDDDAIARLFALNQERVRNE